jgi:hypothetical protein
MTTTNTSREAATTVHATNHAAMNTAFLEYYRCPESLASLELMGPLFEFENTGQFENKGSLHFGSHAIRHGRRPSLFPFEDMTGEVYNALRGVAAGGDALQLTFSPSDIVTNLRYERYARLNNGQGPRGMALLLKAYYLARPFLSDSLRQRLQRLALRDWKDIRFPQWPLDSTVERILEKLLALLLKACRLERIPFIWFWPDGSPSCAIMTHDVETLAGRDFCSQLMDLDIAFGIRSSFQVVPEERYSNPPSFLEEIRSRGFEINIHDLNHDGHLFRNKKRFLSRVERINRYGKEYGADGFRSAVLYRNPDWYGALDFAYDMSVPNVGHLEAQRGGCCSIMPFFIGKILELPVTTTQDYSLFHILKDYSIDLWKRQVRRIVAKHGLVSFIVHPDYILESRARDTYKSLLGYLAGLRLEKKIWIALPREVNQWWRVRNQMKLVRRGNDWVIEGPESHRARLAYAMLEGDRVSYQLA